MADSDGRAVAALEQAGCIPVREDRDRNCKKRRDDPYGASFRRPALTDQGKQRSSPTETVAADPHQRP